MKYCVEIEEYSEYTCFDKKTPISKFYFETTEDALYFVNILLKKNWYKFTFYKVEGE